MFPLTAFLDNPLFSSVKTSYGLFLLVKTWGCWAGINFLFIVSKHTLFVLFGSRLSNAWAIKDVTFSEIEYLTSSKKSR